MQNRIKQMINNRIRQMINNRIRQMTKGPEALNIESPGLVQEIQSSPFIKSI